MLLAGLVVLPAAARELGDFGRAKPNEPWFDTELAVTDQERELADRVWRFIVTPNALAAWFGQAWELSASSRQPPDRYYRWLREQRYASSRIRYNTLTDDIEADILTLPGTFAAICAVIEVDRQRVIAAEAVPDLEPRLRRQLGKRLQQNREDISRFVMALNYRETTYDYALSRLLVESPHEEAVVADTALNALAPWVEQANAGDFCETRRVRRDRDEVAIRPRVLLGHPGEGEYRK